MMISRAVGTGMALVALLSCAAMPAWADREDVRRQKALPQKEVRQKEVRQEVRRDDPR